VHQGAGDGIRIDLGHAYGSSIAIPSYLEEVRVEKGQILNLPRDHEQVGRRDPDRVQPGDPLLVPPAEETNQAQATAPWIGVVDMPRPLVAITVA
jgi:hypothetical protein